MPKREAMSLTLPSLLVCLYRCLPKISCLLFTVAVLHVILSICKFVLSLWSLGCSLCGRDCFVLPSLQDCFPPGHQIRPSVSLLAFDQLTVHIPIWLACRLMGVLEMMAIGFNYLGYRILPLPCLDGWWVAEPCKTEGFWAAGQCSLFSSSPSCETNRGHRSNQQLPWKDDSVTNEWLGHLKNHHQRYLKEIILIRIYKMWFNKVHWQGSLYYLLNEWNIKSK